MSEEENKYSGENPDNVKKTADNPAEAAKEENKTAENSKKTSAEEELKQLKEENAKLKDSYLRAYAESENTKKRCRQEIEKNSKFAVAEFAKELLTVADNLHRAIASVKPEDKEKCRSLLQGVEMTQKELNKVFSKFGVKRIESMGRVFNPNFERVVQEVEDKDKPAGTVVSELQSAYTLNERILREAMVVVTKGGPKK